MVIERFLKVLQDSKNFKEDCQYGPEIKDNDDAIVIY